MVRLPFALVCALGALLLMPQAAAAGGWWSSIRPDHSLVAPGQRVQVEERVLFRSVAAAEAARKRFHVYLLRGFDDSIVDRAMRKRWPGDWWSLGGAEAIEVGEVAVRVADSNLVKATAAFTVPEVAPGTYHLMLCDTGCAEPLADVVPADGFRVVADPATAVLAGRVDRLERRIRHQADRIAAARVGTRKARGAARDAARDARSDVERLEARVASLADEDRSLPLWLLIGALAAALALGLRWRLAARRAEAALAARGHAELVGLLERDGRGLRDQELRDPVADADGVGRVAVGVQQHDGHSAAVAGVDQAGRVHDGDPVARR